MINKLLTVCALVEEGLHMCDINRLLAILGHTNVPLVDKTNQLVVCCSDKMQLGYEIPQIYHIYVTGI